MNKILLLLMITFSMFSYGQFNKLALPAKVYLKNGELKEGKAYINDQRSRLGINGVGFGKKNKKYMKEISFTPTKAKGGKSEKINVENIDKIEFETRSKMFGRETKIATYRPILIENEVQLSKEIVPNKLYALVKVQTIDMTDKLPGDDHAQKKVYYIKNGDSYEKTTLASIKMKYRCSMDEDGNREEKIAKCLEGK